MSDRSSSQPPQSNRLLTSIVNATVFFSASCGIPLEQLFKLSGIDPLLLMDTDSYIPQNFYVDILRHLSQYSKKGNISLELAQSLPVTFLGSPGKIFLQAPDLQSILELAVKNADLFSDQLELELMKRGDECWFRMYHPLDDIDEGLGGEIGIGIAARILKDLFGTGVVIGVRFQHEPRCAHAVYEDFFKVPVSFSARYNALILDPDTLHRKNRKMGPVPQHAVKPQLTALRQAFGLSDEDRLADVREAVAHNVKKGDYSVQGLARCMGMSTRSLQLRMQGSGANARSLLEEARYARALELLYNNKLGIDDVASKVGFSCERSFRRAFERWAKKSPAQARREMNTP